MSTFAKVLRGLPTVLRGHFPFGYLSAVLCCFIGGQLRARRWLHAESRKGDLGAPQIGSNVENAPYDIPKAIQSGADIPISDIEGELVDDDFFDDRPFSGASGLHDGSAVTSQSKTMTFDDWKAEADRRCLIETHNNSWANAALDIVRDLLASMDALTLHRFQTNIERRQLYITLDKFEDLHGSPSLDEITDFARLLTKRLGAGLGEELAETLRCEVSTPGAERDVRLPFELDRFRPLPMKVHYTDEEGKTYTSVMEYLNRDGENSIWKCWKGRGNHRMTKAKKAKYEKEYTIPLRHLTHVQLFLDI